MHYIQSIKILNVFCFSILIKLFDLTAETEKICQKEPIISEGQIDYEVEKI